MNLPPIDDNGDDTEETSALDPSKHMSAKTKCEKSRKNKQIGSQPSKYKLFMARAMTASKEESRSSPKRSRSPERNQNQSGMDLKSIVDVNKGISPAPVTPSIKYDEDDELRQTYYSQGKPFAGIADNTGNTWYGSVHRLQARTSENWNSN